ncbi:peptide chain release factor N(5)-glutamine methyltransferase [Merismopedia glauca]|uniref:Release factor glutamine methyltransferase n=1 Tax=Merismopedia glauca CCAP 1448/3 TaxID=1296344 RepID=A0A2T1BXS8_9CYAN|nr:peptide chain release factor N(5)-glutamine methyltransferase [Merismopedia glauca]PSB00758.1 peptide chain release factor N(5)-glutamine methyltransferase [Merismopedia glauca CCAP 1448/3]
MEVSGIELWQWHQDAIAVAKSENIPVGEINWLLREFTGLEALSLRLGSFKGKPQVKMQISLADLSKLWEQRVTQRVPVQYLVQLSHWRHFCLTVSPAVLIPRPETECLIELAMSYHSGIEGDWVDLGTGSGAIALGLAEAFPQATIHAVDVSPEALTIARQNALRLGFADRIEFYQGDWWQPLAGQISGLAGMVANPPYIPTQMVSQLQPEVAWHEPHLALDGGVDGLDCVRQLIQSAPDYLQPRGIWLVELMAGQAPMVVELLQASGAYLNIQIHTDLAGIERFVLAQID